MRSLRGLTIEELRVENADLNIFTGISGDVKFVMRQPRRKDITNHKRAWKKLSERSKTRYRRLNVEDKYYDIKYRCKLPLYKGEVPGWFPLVMEVDDEIVGFNDAFLKYGSDFGIHQIPEKEVGCNMTICVLDKYHGMGVGSFYGEMSEYIGKHFNVDWMLGYTPFKKGTFHIRIKQGWELLERRGPYAVLRKRL